MSKQVRSIRRNAIAAAPHVRETRATGPCVQRHRSWLLLSVCCMALSAFALGCISKIPTAPASPTAAVVGKRTITLEEVDDTVKNALFERAFESGDTARLFEARQTALEGMIDSEIVSQAAKASGLTPEVWLTAEVRRRTPVSEADIDTFWQEYEHRIPKDRPVDAIRTDIHNYLLEERAKALIVELRNEASVRMVLARPRFNVEPRGPSRGPETAPVTIVEFSDFQCPYCLRVSPTIDELIAKYPEQVRLYYRHLPLGNHDRARPAALAAVCAERQGEFWEYHDVLFGNQGALGDEDLRRHAEQVGLDLALFDSCLTSPEAAARVDEDVAAANVLGITGTPAFFVNGIPMKGAQPLDKFVRLVEEELAAATPAQPKPVVAESAATTPATTPEPTPAPESTEAAPAP